MQEGGNKGSNFKEGRNKCRQRIIKNNAEQDTRIIFWQKTIKSEKYTITN